MIRHVVALTLHSDAGDASRRALLDGLASLPAAVPSIRKYSIGTDIGVNPGNADVVAIGDFDDVAGYLEYRDHPAHQRVVTELILPILSERTAIQYEL